MDIDGKKLNSVAKSANINVEQLKAAASTGNIDDFIDKNLTAQDADKLRNVLKSKEATQQLLSTPQAKELLKKLMKG